MSIVSTTIVSALNNYNSIVPIVAKDLVENGGRTAMAYHSAGEKTRGYEAKEKFIEANATSVLWYGAIPFIKKVFDLSIFKLAKLNPDVSLELITNKKGDAQSAKSVLERVKKGLLPEKFVEKRRFPTEKTSVSNAVEMLKAASKRADLYKKLHISRNIIATAIPTLISAFVLPKAIIALTQHNVDKKRTHSDYFNNIHYNDSMAFPMFKRAMIGQGDKTSANKIAFKGIADKLLSSATSAQKTLLNDMVMVDVGISASRIYYANKREKEALNNRITNAPYAAALEKMIREGGFLYLVYFGGKHIKNLIDKITKNKLDPLVLEDKELAKEIKENKFAQNPVKGLSESQILDYVDQNIRDEKNVFIKYAKKTGLIKTVRDENNQIFRNPLIWQDTKKLSQFFETLVSEAKGLSQEMGMSLESVIANKSKIKRAGIYGNLAVSSFAVCYILPKIMYSFRKWYTGSNEEPGIDKVIHTNCTLK